MPNCLHHTSYVPQQCVWLIAANLALAGCLGWKWSLWPVPTWLAVQRSKVVFWLNLYDSINDMKYLWNVFHYTSAVPKPFLLLMAANLALAGFLGWKWSLWPVPTRLALQRSKDVFFLTLFESINDMTHVSVCQKLSMMHILPISITRKTFLNEWKHGINIRKLLAK